MEEEKAAAERTAEAGVIKKECEKALAEVTPFLRESENALKSLQKEDVYPKFSIPESRFDSAYLRNQDNDSSANRSTAGNGGCLHHERNSAKRNSRQYSRPENSELLGER